MEALVVPKAALLAQLNALSAALGLWDLAEVHLYKNNLDPNPQTLLAAFEECDFSGYAASSAINWEPAGYSPTGTPTVVGDTKVFASTAPFTVANTVYGAYITNAAGTVLLWSIRFAAPVLIGEAFIVLSVVPAYPNFQPSN